MTSERLPDLVGRRDDVLDQREADRSASRLLPSAAGWIFSIIDNCLHLFSVSPVAAPNNIFKLLPLRGPDGPLKLEEVRLNVTAVAGAPTIECALFNYSRATKTFVTINGSYAKWTVTATGRISKTLDFTLRPSREPVFFGFRRSGGTSISFDSAFSSQAAIRPRKKTLTGAFPRQILAGALPIEEAQISIPSAVYLSNRMISVL